MTRPKPDPRDDKHFARVSAWLKANRLRGHISASGDVRIVRR